jgi:hypothetical protein
MIIYVDIDETICQTEGTNYEQAKPIPHKIQKINELFELGHTITYWTARGALSGKDYYELTMNQLISWGAKFHKLDCSKPFYDIFIDDKTLNSIDDL